MNRCTCSPAEIGGYLKRISQPLLDRIDLCAEAAPISYQALSSPSEQEGSAQIRQRVEKAVRIQKERYEGTTLCFNADLTPRG